MFCGTVDAIEPATVILLFTWLNILLILNFKMAFMNFKWTVTVTVPDPM